MNYIKSLSFILFIFLFSLNAFSQTEPEKEDDKLSLEKGTIDNQFEYILRKSGNFKGTNGQPYEAVQLGMLIKLRANTNDSLKTIRKDLVDTQTIVDSQTKEISDLKLSLSDTKINLDKTNSEKNNMALFGLQMSKTNYNVLMWAIIASLLAFLLFFIYKFKNSNAVTRAAKQALEEIEEEFEEHRKTALEREQIVRRQLQDEINKQKGV